MKKLIFLLTVAVVSGVVLGTVFAKKKFTSTTSPSPSPQIESEKTEKIVSKPRNLSIPAISINAFVEEVGLDEKKRMDVPKDVANVGWYNLGSRPGQVGNAVIAGHLDDKNGQPAVFFELPKITVGDEIKVTDENNQEFKFKVTDKETYDFDKVPLQEIFGSSEKTRLNLITCGGYFDNAAKNYSKRVVVYSELIN